MKKIYLKIFLITIFFSLLSCKEVREAYVVSNFQNIRVLERQDHKFCTSLNLDIEKDKEFYWRCRLALAKYKIRNNTSNTDETKFNFQISDLVTKISLNLTEPKDAVLTKENNKLDNRQHQICLGMGFSPDTRDQTKVDDYFACRKVLMEDEQLVPAFGNSEYLKYPNRSFNIGYIVDKRLEEEIKRQKEAEQHYPNCTKYNIRSANFTKCTKGQDRSKLCLKQIIRKKFAKEAEQKMRCQKESYTTFPNAFLKEDKRKNVGSAAINADVYNQNNFNSIGLTEDKLKKFESTEESEKDSKEKQKELEKKINSKQNLYSKFELTRLRQKYIIACQKEADEKIAKYIEDLEEECESLTLFEETND